MSCAVGGHACASDLGGGLEISPHGPPRGFAGCSNERAGACRLLEEKECPRGALRLLEEEVSGAFLVLEEKISGAFRLLEEEESGALRVIEEDSSGAFRYFLCVSGLCERFLLPFPYRR